MGLTKRDEFLITHRRKILEKLKPNINQNFFKSDEEEKEFHMVFETIHKNGFIEIEKGKSEIGLYELTPFELDLYHKGYKIVSDFKNKGDPNDCDYIKYSEVYKDNKLYCKVINNCETNYNPKQYNEVIYLKNKVTSDYKEDYLNNYLINRGIPYDGKSYYYKKDVFIS
jgi:hypothetical protein